MMNLLSVSEDAELVLVVVWGIVVVGLVLNLLSCWICCCCRTFDQPRRVLAGVTAFTLFVALVTTVVYTQDLGQLWSSRTAHRALFVNGERSARVLKTLKWT